MANPVSVNWRSIQQIRWWKYKPSFHDRMVYFYTHNRQHMPKLARQTKARMAKYVDLFRWDGTQLYLETDTPVPWQTDENGVFLLENIDSKTGEALPPAIRTFHVPKSKENVEEIVRAAYDNYDGGYASADKIHRLLQEAYIGISYKQVSNTLRRYVSRQMENPVAGKQIKAIESKLPNDRWVLDTMEITTDKRWIKQNLNHRFILNVVDHYSGFVIGCASP